VISTVPVLPKTREISTLSPISKVVGVALKLVISPEEMPSPTRGAQRPP
jgi:hypothetical protein